MTNINIDRLIESCDALQRRTCYHDGCMHVSSKCFMACLRAFEDKALPAEAITFRVFLNVPVMRFGEATIHRDGSMEIRIADDATN